MIIMSYVLAITDQIEECQKRPDSHSLDAGNFSPCFYMYVQFSSLGGGGGGAVVLKVTWILLPDFLLDFG